MANGREVYSGNYANHCVNIKNLLEYNSSYAASVATNEFYFLDTSRNAEEKEFEVSGTKEEENIAKVLLKEKPYWEHQP